MKAVLGLALLCCFVVGSLGNHCENSSEECENVEGCACANPLVIKAKIKNLLDDDYPMKGKYADQVLYKIKTKEVYKPADSKNNIGFLVAPKGCKWTLPVGDMYYFFCHEIKVKWNGKKGRGCKVGMPKGFKKVKANAKNAQEQFLRQLRDGQDVC